MARIEDVYLGRSEDWMRGLDIYEESRGRGVCTGVGVGFHWKKKKENKGVSE